MAEVNATGMPDILTATQKQTAQEQQVLADSFKRYQDAARTKDEDPENYEAARMRYFALKNGPSWAAQEQKRIAGDKLDPVISKFRDMYQSLDSEQNVQRAYTDSVSTIRDQQQSLADNAEKHVSFFGKLIDTEQQKKGAFNRMVELTTRTPAGTTPLPQDVPLLVKYFSGYPSSFSIILDVLLSVIILFTLYLFLRKSSLAAQGTRTFWGNMFGSYGSPGLRAPFSPPFSPSAGPVRTTTFR
uniref:Uncharacterized protein n=1 Tax=viral metagenome TaxID=1070528 RepID=A0A6C0I7L6_9ZZZZ